MIKPYIIKRTAFILIIALLCLSYIEDESTIPVANNFNAQESKKSEEANKIAKEVNSIITKDYEEGNENKFAANNLPTYLPNCFTRTAYFDGTTYSVELDFGIKPCIMPNGISMTGKLYTLILVTF